MKLNGFVRLVDTYGQKIRVQGVFALHFEHRNTERILIFFRNYSTFGLGSGPATQVKNQMSLDHIFKVKKTERMLKLRSFCDGQMNKNHQ